MKPGLSGGLVYSTEVGRTCPVCRQGIAACVCKQNQPNAKTDGIVRIALSTKGRGGKSVTVITGVALGAADLAALGKKLRSACGSGGTTKGDVIEIQGDHCANLMALLEKLEFKVKRVGG